MASPKAVLTLIGYVLKNRSPAKAVLRACADLLMHFAKLCNTWEFLGFHIIDGMIRTEDVRTLLGHAEATKWWGQQAQKKLSEPSLEHLDDGMNLGWVLYFLMHNSYRSKSVEDLTRAAIHVVGERLDNALSSHLHQTIPTCSLPKGSEEVAASIRRALRGLVRKITLIRCSACYSKGGWATCFQYASRPRPAAGECRAGWSRAPGRGDLARAPGVWPTTRGQKL